MGASGEFGPDFSNRVLANLVSEEPNVRQTLAKVVLGEADTAIVYTTDVTPETAPKVRQISIEDRFNVLAFYPVAVVKGTAQPAGAERFIAYLRSAEGRAILAKHGFMEAPPR
jgi:molybdate transport system substrate-binding protein